MPNYPDAHYNLALILLARGELDSAIRHLREAIRHQPGFAAGHNRLGNALRQQGDLASLPWHITTPPSVRFHARPRRRATSGERCSRRATTKQALVHSQEACPAPKLTCRSVLTNFANVLIVHGRLEEAKERLLEAVRREPKVAAIHAALAHLYERIGELDQAKRSLREARRCEPDDPQVLARLAAASKDKLSQDDQARIERVLAEGRLRDEPRWQLLFGLAQALDAQGQFDRAAELSIEANALLFADLKRRCRVYDPGEHEQFVTRLIATFTLEYFSRIRGFGIDSERPVFVVGMPRSGTSLTEQVLASHPRVFGAGELTLAHELFESLPAVTSQPGKSPVDCVSQIDRETAGRIARGYLDRLAAINDSADRIVDKLPDNTLYLGFVATLFPREGHPLPARPARRALSCWMTNFAHVRWACDPDQIAGRISRASTTHGTLAQGAAEYRCSSLITKHW